MGNLLARQNADSNLQAQKARSVPSVSSVRRLHRVFSGESFAAEGTLVRSKARPFARRVVGGPWRSLGSGVALQCGSGHVTATRVPDSVAELALAPSVTLSRRLIGRCAGFVDSGWVTSRGRADASRVTGARRPHSSGCEKHSEGGVTIVRERARVSDRLQKSAVGFLFGSAPSGCG